MFKPAIVAICIASTISWIAPAQAFPVTSAPVADKVISTPPVATNVDWRGYSTRWPHNSGFGNHGGYYRGYHGGYDRGGYYGYHHHSNAGAIIGGLAAGAIIGGALASQRHYRSYGSHESWCASRYRTYRASDNTYQPTNGPRRQCR